MRLQQYKKTIAEGKKICFFCLNGTHARKYKIFTHKFQQFFWVCRPCLEIRGVGNVIQELEKIPLEQSDINFFKNKKGADKK